MKSVKLLLCAAFLTCCIGFESHAQVVFSEDFDGVGGPTAGGAGTYSFPAGWLLRNVDNLTPAASVSYVNEAWERREDFATNTSDSVAFSTSWYAPAGSSDDWMWTPQINIPVGGLLVWSAKALDPAYPDGYEVRVMTGTQPTGGTGSLGNMVSNSTVIFSTTAENPAWTEHQVDLSAYAGQAVYIGFRNNSTDKFILLIDDIVVRVEYQYEAEIIANATISEYTQIPLQQITPLALTAGIKNKGVDTLINVRLRADIYDASYTLLNSVTSASILMLLPDSSQLFDCGFYTPTITGLHHIILTHLFNETDQNPINDSASYSILVTDTVYARDNGAVAGSLGIGAGNGGYLGQRFTINTPTELRSVTYVVNGGSPVDRTACAIWDMVGGIPNAIIAATDTIFYPTNLADTLTQKIAGGSLLLMPGDYLVSAVEFDSTIQLATATALFTPGTVWVNWPTNPNGNWSNVETFGASFAKSFIIRPNLYSCPVLTLDLLSTDASCATCNDGSLSAIPDGGTAPYSYLWSNSDNTQAPSNVLPGIYQVTVTDAFGCSISDTISVSYSTSVTEALAPTMQILPNPNNGSFKVVIDPFTDQEGTIEIFNITGAKIYETMISNTGRVNQNIELGNLPSGSYTLRLISNQAVISQRLIIY